MSDNPENEKTATRSRLNAADRRGFRIVKTTPIPFEKGIAQDNLSSKNLPKDTKQKPSLLDYLESLAEHVEKVAASTKS